MRSKCNGAVCEDLIDCIQTMQEEQLDPMTATKKEVFVFNSDDIKRGCDYYIKSFKEQDSAKKDIGTQTYDVILNVPGAGLIFCSP